MKRTSTKQYNYYSAMCSVEATYAVSIYIHTFVHIQWNLSIVGTIGTQLAVLYREVSLIQR